MLTFTRSQREKKNTLRCHFLSNWQKNLSSTTYSVGKALGTQSISFVAVRMQVDKTFGEENVEIPSKTV